MFAFEHYGIVPDMVVIGKGLGGAVFPMAALIARRDLDVAADRALGHYTHEKSSVGCAAALATLEVIEQEHLLDRSRTLGAHALERLRRSRRAIRWSATCAASASCSASSSPRRRPGAARGRAGHVRLPGARPVVQGRPGQRAHAVAAARHRARRSRPRVRHLDAALAAVEAGRIADADAAQPARRRVVARLGHAYRATGILRIYGGSAPGLRHSVENRFGAFLAGLGVTGLIQSSTATALIVAAFAGQGLIATAPALAVMLGADVGTSLMVNSCSRSTCRGCRPS